MNKFLIFDLDGTLLDTASFAVTALRDAIDIINKEKQYSILLPSDEVICSSFGLPISDYYRSLLTPWTMPIEVAVHQKAMQLQYEMLKAGKARIYDGVESLLRFLKQEGIRMAIVSCASLEYLNAVRSCLSSLERYIDTWISAPEHNSCNKIDAMRQFATSKRGRILAVAGDRSIDMDSAHQIGVLAIGCLYGYGSIDELIFADYLATSPLQMKEIIFGLIKNIGDTR